MNRTPTHRITGVDPGSIAEELGIESGDELLEIGGVPIVDVFDYRMAVRSEHVEVLVRTKHGLQLFDIEKDEEDDLGLQFADPLMDLARSCGNRCVFCFIDQLPKGLRSSLYFKDDDVRLSFLTGNYVTLTNLSDEELDRIIGFRLSPVNVSVHSLTADVREKMLRNRFAGSVAGRMRKLLDNGIAVNAQIVLCPGFNDGAELERTLDELEAMGPGLASVSVVPVGLTRYREENGLADLRPVDATGAEAVLHTIARRQQKLQAERGERLVFAADEFYLIAGRPLPGLNEYENLPQLENGVGMVPLFLHEMAEGLKDRTPAPHNERPLRIRAVTGTDFAPFLDRFGPDIREAFGLDWTVQAVKNRFFGDTITVAGLVTGQDIAAQLTGAADLLLVPDTMLRDGENCFLDDETVEGLEQRAGIPVRAVGATAPELLDALDELAREGVNT